MPSNPSDMTVFTDRLRVKHMYEPEELEAGRRQLRGRLLALSIALMLSVNLSIAARTLIVSAAAAVKLAPLLAFAAGRRPVGEVAIEPFLECLP